MIVGGEDVSAQKPDPEGLLAALHTLKVQRTLSLYVGDSLTDADTANRAGVRFVATLTGVTDKAAFEGKPVELIARDLFDLVKVLN